ncbi:MAG TPA: DUF3800 domain-containing protein [Azospirillum sp.]
MPTAPAELTPYHIYGDETCQTQHTYMVLGCLVCHPRDAKTIASSIRKIKESRNEHGELKWEKIKKRNIEKYESVVDAFFSTFNSNSVHFHSVVVNTSELNYRAYSNGDKDVGFNKFIFQILHKCCREHGGDARFYVFLDKRTTRQSLDALRMMLNHHARNKLKIRHWPFKTIEFRDSEKSLLLQMNDILLGAVGYRVNKKHEAEGSAQAKMLLSERIRELSGLQNLEQQTPISRKKFTIWHFKLQPRIGAPRRPRLVKAIA